MFPGGVSPCGLKAGVVHALNRCAALHYLDAAGFVSLVPLGSTVLGENCPGLGDPTIPRIGAVEVSVGVALYPWYSVVTVVGLPIV